MSKCKHTHELKMYRIIGEFQSREYTEVEVMVCEDCDNERVLEY